jgi:hypothetical protein
MVVILIGPCGSTRLLTGASLFSADELNVEAGVV